MHNARTRLCHALEHAVAVHHAGHHLDVEEQHIQHALQQREHV
jgi:hypothetical protein